MKVPERVFAEGDDKERGSETWPPRNDTLVTKRDYRYRTTRMHYTPHYKTALHAKIHLLAV